ncbi:CHASE2 domain-containing protein [[Limnothrix rosea] IAM M-220]|uniref:CHASE2 domain-containing protein n=1 Tax=[Limnothrix rosea] IAM M-220 TaxID=454133 RepID=UPI0009600D9D|nr:CHASE2 domain-containing protein [[Limnothrix rosea] IAM M-220]OKH15242.1 hypothetical protein NIES208_12830 [[Limnothrix rosea] IAM M-220]
MASNQVHTFHSKLGILKVAKVAIGTSIFTVLATLTGIFQGAEWSLWDRYFIWRSYEVKDPEIVVVTIDEAEATASGTWPLSDLALAELLQIIDQQEPKVIGLNLFRNLPVGEGETALNEAFRTIPNLIGTNKTIGTKVAAPEVLEKKDQVGFSDIIVDADGVARRALLSVRSGEGQEVEGSFALQVALNYLEQEGISIELEQPKFTLPLLGNPINKEYARLGKTQFRLLESNDGGYVRVDNGGYQVMLNYRGGGPQHFYTVSMRDLMAGDIPAELVESVDKLPLKNRIVIIGITSDSNGAQLLTPYNRAQGNQLNVSHQQTSSTPGVFIHAHIVSQLVQGAVNGRALFKMMPQQGEWLLVFVWAIAGASGRWLMLNVRGLPRRMAIHNLLLVGYLGVGTAIIVSCSYGAFLLGWWMPAIPAVCGFVTASLIMGSYYSHELQKMATLDALTQVANRRYFEEYLYQTWWKCERDGKPLSLIMCDIDHFKLYNDFYGHQVGDRCLQQVVASIQQSLRDSDLVARYGGEEFIIVLPNTDEAGASHVAERICDKVVDLKVAHEKSLTSSFVTVSCGVSSVQAHPQLSPVELIASADRALYLAKAEGRNQAKYQPYQNLPPLK